MYVCTYYSTCIIPTYIRPCIQSYVRTVCTYAVHTCVHYLRTYFALPLLLASLQGGYDAGFLYQYSMADLEVGQAAEPSEPKQSVPLPPFAGRDTPLTALTFRYSQGVHSSALLRVCTASCVYIRITNCHHCTHTYVCMVRTVRIMHVRTYVCTYVCMYCVFVCCVFDCQVLLPFPLAILDLIC